MHEPSAQTDSFGRGFTVEITASGGNPDYVGMFGVWAYTAP